MNAFIVENMVVIDVVSILCLVSALLCFKADRLEGGLTLCIVGAIGFFMVMLGGV